MAKYSANLGFLWPDLPIPDRIRAAAAAEFEAVEFHFPYDTDARELSEILTACGVQALAVNTLPGNLEAGDFGLAAVPGREDEARAAIDQAISYASKINARRVHVMAGVAGDGKQVMETYRENLVYACEQAAARDLGILIEPINRQDRPGYTLHRIDQAVNLIDSLRSCSGISNLGLMFDCYHVQVTEGNLVANLERATGCLAHVQIASVPGRAEPDRGEIDYAWLMRWLDQSGYEGYVGAEYHPAGSTDDGLGWFSDRVLPVD